MTAKKTAKFELVFLKKEKISKDAYSFYFDRKGLNFDFFSGQYLKIYLQIENSDKRGSSRYFTISSSPTDKDFITISTRIIKSSFKLKLNSLVPGEKISAFGPIGYFDFDMDSKIPNIFITGGMGITPFHSILRFIDNKKLKVDATLFSSFPFKDEAVFFDELNKISFNNPTIKVIYTLTKDKKSLDFEIGRVDEDLVKKYAPNYMNSKFFIVGPQVMVDSMFDMIRNAGIAEENIFKEDFLGY